MFLKSPIEIVASCNVVDGRFNKSAKQLSQNGANIFRFKLKEPEQGRMHNKFIVFGKNVYDRPLIWTGSANFTGSARSYNKENVSIFDNEFMINKYDERFEYLKDNLCTVYKYIKPPCKRRKKTRSVISNNKKDIIKPIPEERIVPRYSNNESRPEKRKRDLVQDRELQKLGPARKKRRVI